jgi:hypothetical protein
MQDNIATFNVGEGGLTTTRVADDATEADGEDDTAHVEDQDAGLGSTV